MALLSGTGITKYFGGLAALHDVDFSVEEGEILGVIGPNGAGKTTLLNVITRAEGLTRGSIHFRGRPIHHGDRHAVGRLGIARTFQIVRPFHGLTVEENTLIGALFGASWSGRSRTAALQAARDVLEFVGLGPKATVLATHLNLAERKRLELAKALAMEPTVLLLDEVLAGLTPAEVLAAMEVVRAIRARGVTILVIEHVMKAIMGLSDRVIVLHQGEKIAEGRPEQIVADAGVVRAYLGARYAERLRRAEES